MFTGKAGKCWIAAIITGALFFCPVAASVANAECEASKAFYHLDEAFYYYNLAYYNGLLGDPCAAADMIYYAYLESYEAFYDALYSYFYYNDSDSYYLYEYSYYTYAYMSYAYGYIDDGCSNKNYTSFINGLFYSISAMQHAYDALWYGYWTGVYWEYECW